MDAQTLFHPAALDSAYAWLCKQRLHYPADADIWQLRFHWHASKAPLLQRLRSGRYTFSPLQRVTKANGEVIHLWSSQDALVIKAMAVGLAQALNISPNCTHVKGHGGLKQTVARVQRQLPVYPFVMRTDVKGYYAAIDQVLLQQQIADRVSDPTLCNYLWQVIRRTVHDGGVYREIMRGISRGCPISPLLGALYLKGLDNALGTLPQSAGTFYTRYMDDIVILATSRWKLRRAISTLNQHFAALKLEQHPGKTFIGRTDKGFEFLGYRLSPRGLGVAEATLGRFVVRCRRLYEQEPGPTAGGSRLEDYVRRWLRWLQAGIANLTVSLMPFSVASLYRRWPLVQVSIKPA